MIVLMGGIVCTIRPGPSTPLARGGAINDPDPLMRGAEGTRAVRGTDGTGGGGWRAACLAAILWFTVRHIDCTSLLCLNKRERIENG